MALGTVTASYELRFDTGRVCLDLLATTHPGERLGSVDALRAWITGAGLVPEGTPLAHADPSWLDAFRELRAYLVPLVRAPGSPSEGPALSRVNDLARSAPPAPRAVPGADGTLVQPARRPARPGRADRRGGPGRGGPADRPGRPREPAPVRGRQLPHRVRRRLAGTQKALVLQRDLREPGTRGPPPPPYGSPHPRVNSGRTPAPD